MRLQASKMQKRSDGKQKRKEQKDEWKRRKMEESGGFIYRIIVDYFLLKYEFDKDPDPEKKYFYDDHHPIPRSIGRVIAKKIENGEFSAEQLIAFKRVDSGLTIKIPMLYHRNFNELFSGDCLLTQVIKRLDEKIFNANYCVTSSADKKKILRFMFYVAHHNGISVDPDYISWEVAKKYALVPREMADIFCVSYEDVMRYLEDNFFYPEYEKHWDIWDVLEETIHKKPPMLQAAGEDMAVPAS
jgi:hypothetical protein